MYCSKASTARKRYLTMGAGRSLEAMTATSRRSVVLNACK